ncbi:glycosyltransferase family 4 protein [Hirschia baltica]|uniref:Glycosyl transferase group 1 n=1 Tax=Hirschia baltica (strain ATCC 49814 / DSM 5838 / IFAM 1418) TaxID=582402 RepID=C6XK27_HIRBI|nr:glycosyltransferase family 4 protein [Hirschia baltica]ACT59472.1 glycosyl transferase group 1 [Hirschia baltica ATCC 49814]
MKTVTIVQRRLTHYRVPFFEDLKCNLEENGINLKLIYGSGASKELLKNDGSLISWADQVPIRYLFGERFNWLSFSKSVRQTDLLIITQENSQLANIKALINRPSKKIAFWGHGANFQGNDNSVREHLKRCTNHLVDWYFAYTDASVQQVQKTGFRLDKITCVNNSICTKSIDAISAIRDPVILETDRIKLGLGAGPVGVFIGSLYREKRLEFLFTAADLVKNVISDFQLVIVGSGPDVEIVQQYAENRSWVKFVGALHGEEKARILRLASIKLNPGLVGLGILDAFAAGVPFITTDCGIHSPEIAYLNSENGIMTQDSIIDFVEGCIRILSNPKLAERLSRGCITSASKYSLQNMVTNFSSGVIKCLDQ